MVSAHITQLLTTQPLMVASAAPNSPPPNSKCLQRLRAMWDLYLQAVHSRRRTTFLVVFAFLWKTGFV